MHFVKTQKIYLVYYTSQYTNGNEPKSCYSMADIDSKSIIYCFWLGMCAKLTSSLFLIELKLRLGEKWNMGYKIEIS